MHYVPVYTLILLFVLGLSFRQNKGALSPHTIRAQPKDVITSHRSNNITRTIRQDGKGNIWIASFEGIIRYDGKTFTNITRNVTSNPFVSVLEDRKGNFWFASAGSGVYYYDGKSFQNFTTKQGLASNRVTCMYEDKAGNIWFGTVGGASRYDGKSFRNYYVMEDKTGISLLNFTSIEGQPPNFVNSIMEDKTGRLWFGTRYGAFVYDGKTFAPFTHRGKPFKNVRSIIEDKNGTVWLGGSDGLWRYEGRSFTHFDNRFTRFTPDFVGYIYEDKNGNIWTSSLSTINQSWALSRYPVNSLTGKAGPVTEIKPQKAAMVLGILEHDNGSIWFDTTDGVYRYDGTPAKDSWELVVTVHHGGC